MADFCLKCHNKIHKTDYSHQDVIEEWGICEECGKYKYTVVGFRGWGLFGLIGRLYVTLFKKKQLDIEYTHEEVWGDTEQDTLDF